MGPKDQKNKRCLFSITSAIEDLGTHTSTLEKYTEFNSTRNLSDQMMIDQPIRSTSRSVGPTLLVKIVLNRCVASQARG